MQTIFSLSSLLVLPFWLLMIFVPRWHWTQRIMQSPLVAAAPALLYAILVIPQAGTLLPALMHPTLASVAALLATPTGATIGWIHFLAFDLFVGRWIYLDSQESGITAWIVSPILFLTLMFGPLGFISYLSLRAGYAAIRRSGSVRRRESAVS
ncbi:MAG TPA: ABA4-like family protein [Ktedonobacteraceae bacterium]|nr:ABA4-like family protein [Ktedonobacteraceae bacterium]